MIIASTADIHSPIYYEEFVRALDEINVKPDLFLIAGDIIDRGKIEECEKIQNAFFGKITCPIVACFGNNEYNELREEIKKKLKNIRFLDDQSIILEIGGISVGIFGTTGSLDEPTRWQRANIPNIERIYMLRYQLAEKHMERLLTEVKILLTHYAPTYKTLEGENPRFYGSLGSKIYENIIINKKPTLVIHGHSHRGSKFAWVNSVPVFNVAFPLHRKIVIIDTEKLKPGLLKFV
ncbi:MAG: metallophosphoesterase [Candidatus Aenigmarchaeota archaeon]|nr:metallophosphoesterase [Candidatus Aenigmarchaeota archaeon]